MITRMTCILIASFAAVAQADAAAISVGSGDGNFRRIVANGGAIPGVDASSAIVRMGGVNLSLSGIAATAALAVPRALANQPNGWLQLDPTGAIPSTLLPSSQVAADAVARQAAAVAQSLATAAEPANLANKANGWPQLDQNGLIPGALLPASVTAPVDTSARVAAATAQSTASAAALLANAALPAGLANKPAGYPQLDQNGIVPLAILPPGVVTPTDQTARNLAAAAAAQATTAQSLALAAVPAAQANKANGWPQLDPNGLLPTSLLPSSVTSPTDAAARATANAANAAANTAQTIALAAEPMSLANQPNGWAQLDAHGAVPIGLLPSSVTSPVDAAARSAANTAQAAASNAQAVANNAEPANAANRANGWPQLDGSGLVPLGLLPNSVTMPNDTTARTAAAQATATATAAQALASNAEPANAANRAGGFPQLDPNGLVPVSLLPGSVANPVDTTARATANSASSVANAAEPASLANRPNGFPMLDGSGLVPVAALPAAYSSTTAIPTTSLGQPNGPAQLDGQGALSSSVVAAGNGSVQRSLAAHFSDTLNGADFGMKCDNSSDDTAAFNALIAAYQATPTGAKLVLPSGYCLIAGNVTINMPKNLAIWGSGSRNSWLMINSANADGLHFIGSGLATLTLHDFGIGKTAADTSNTGRFGNTAVYIEPQNDANNTIGNVIVSDVDVDGYHPQLGATPSVGWAYGFRNVGLAGPVYYDTNVWNASAYFSDDASAGRLPANLLTGYPTPLNIATVTTYPAALAVGAGTAFYFGGVNGGAFTSDPVMLNSAVNGGVSAVDIGPLEQGFYAVNNKFVYTDWGLRSPDSYSAKQYFSIIGNQFNTVVGGIYSRAENDSVIAGNLFLNQFSASDYWAVWMHNSTLISISGNVLVGTPTNAVASKVVNAIAFTGTPGDPFVSFPNTITGNIVYNYQNGYCFYNDANIRSIEAVGNNAQLCGTYVSDATGSNAYAGNSLGYPDMYDDGKRNITLPIGLTVGSYANTGSLSVINYANTANPVTAFSVQGSTGNTTVGGALSASAITSNVQTLGTPRVDALYQIAAVGTSAAIPAGGASASFFVSPTGGAPSNGSTVNQGNLLLPPNVSLQSGVVRARVTCNDGSSRAEDWSIVQDVVGQKPIGNGTSTLENSSAGAGVEVFGLAFSVGVDTASNTPTLVATIAAPGQNAARPALRCAAKVETQVTN